MVSEIAEKVMKALNITLATSTGWKTPLTVTQDSRREVNGDHACYAFANLDNIKTNDYNYASIPSTGGIDSLRASPVVYAYNYDFNIPLTSKILAINVLPIVQQNNNKNYGDVTKIKTIKLKTGASTTDNGIGTNYADIDFISKLKVPMGSWSTEHTFENGGIYALHGTPEMWNVDLTPAVVNSSNFGWVFQVVGTKYKQWVTPKIAGMKMEIIYSITSEEENTGYVGFTESYYFKIGGKKITFDSNNVYSGTDGKGVAGLNVDKPDDKVLFEVFYTHKGKAGESKIVSLSSDNLKISEEKLKSYTIPTIHYNNDKTNTWHSIGANIYPSVIGGSQVLTINVDNNTFFIVFNVESDNFTEFNDVEKEKYMSDGQFCKVTKCTFIENKAGHVEGSKKYGNGGGLYVLTEHFQHNLNDGNFRDNVAYAQNGVADLYWKKGKKIV